MDSRKNYRLSGFFFQRMGKQDKVRKYFILDVRHSRVTSEELMGTGPGEVLYTETLPICVISIDLM